MQDSFLIDLSRKRDLNQSNKEFKLHFLLFSENLCNVLELTESDTRLRSRPKMESKAAEASGKSAEQRRAERRQKAVIGEILTKILTC